MTIRQQGSLQIRVWAHTYVVQLARSARAPSFFMGFMPCVLGWIQEQQVSKAGYCTHTPIDADCMHVCCNTAVVDQQFPWACFLCSQVRSVIKHQLVQMACFICVHTRGQKKRSLDGYKSSCSLLDIYVPADRKIILITNAAWMLKKSIFFNYMKSRTKLQKIVHQPSHHVLE
jgi:hypothetical protein